MRRTTGHPYGLFMALLTPVLLFASPPQTSYHIKVDQFGYFPASKKVAVIADPQSGYNAAESFLPGTAANQYQVRRWSDDAVIFTGTLQAWNNGATHTQSGDRGWWFDFSPVTTPGSYYVFDLANNVGSYRFEIGDNVYEDVLKQAVRIFFYQRINFGKQSPYADSRWVDGACFEGANQDRFATSAFAKGSAATARDVHGGWMDAGDMNKYTTFANSAVIQLMEAFRINPAVFGDNYNIPESGNGIPDILDEVKWELDFLKRMQDATGTNGFLLKVGVDNYNEVTPPSSDTRPRYYLPECTSGTLSGMSMFAVSGVVLKTVPALSAYGEDLIGRAEAAWVRAKATTNNFTIFQTDCDNGDIKSGDADNSAQEQLNNAFVAAVYLYEATGKAEYKTFAESQYVNVDPYRGNWWGPYWMPQQLALLRLSALPNVSATVASNIRSQKANMEYQYSIPTYTAKTDLYRAHLDDAAHHWGSNQVRTAAGHLNLDFVTFGVNSSRHAQYREVAEQYLHWMHGVNPMAMVMLSNMYAYGAEKCANEIYHAWFTHGSIWDNALSSPSGPAPGYVPGGPNKSYSGSVSGITTQPAQKAYKDWNTGYPENSWEITEPSIYCQASYVMLLARLMYAAAAPPPPADTLAPSAPAGLTISAVAETSLTLNWSAATDNVGVTAYEVYQGTSLLNGNVSGTSYNVTGLTCATSYGFAVKAKDGAGNLSSSSNVATATTKACPVIGNKIIYDDVLSVDWNDASNGSVRNFNNLSPVKLGAKSIRVDYNGNGTLSFIKATAVNTTATTQLRFWIYNSSKNGIRVYTESASAVKSADVYLKPAANKWVEIVISMSQLANPSSVSKIVIQNNAAKAGTMYFDQIQLTGVADASLRQIVPAGGAGIWSVFPNPARDYALMRYSASDGGKGTIDMVDNTGRSVYRLQVQLKKGWNEFRLHLPVLPTGLYYIQMQSGRHTDSKSILVR